MERVDYSKRFRREAIFQAAKSNTAGNFLTLIGIWVVTPRDAHFVEVFKIFASIMSLLSICIIALGIKFNCNLEEKKQVLFERAYYVMTALLTGTLGLFLIFQGEHFGFLSTAHLSTWVFVLATLEACASYLFHVPRFFFITYLTLNLPSAIWLLTLNSTTGHIITLILVFYAPMMFSRVKQLTKLRNQTVDLLIDSQDAKDQLQTFINMIPTKVLWINHDSIVTAMNTQMEKIVSRKDLFVSRERLGSSDDPLLNEILSFLDSSIDRVTKEIMVQTDKGDRWHLCNFSKVDFGKGKETFLVCVDIHDDKVLKHNLEKQKVISEQASRLVNLGEMASGIAHEINNPIAIAQGTASILINQIEKGKVNNPEIIRKLEKIMISHERVIEVIKGMKSFSKRGTSQERAKVEVKDILKSTLVLCSERFKDHGIEVQCEEIDDELTYDCKKQELSQVILSLLNNSFDSLLKVKGDERSLISIGVNKKEKDLVISVSDNGVGVVNTEKVFVPFYSTKSVGTGVGLGLSLSQNIANSYGGRIDVQSDTSQTTFSLILPIEQRT